MFRKILVPLDGSEQAEQVLQTAVSLAQSSENSELLLVRAASYTFLPMAAIPMDTVAAEMMSYELDLSRRYLQEMEATWAERGVRMRSIVVRGDAAAAIVDTAVAEAVDLIVMAAHGHSGRVHWRFGSTAVKVLQQTPCPTLLIHEPRPLHNILITVDGSPLSEKALAPGLALARQFGSAVTLLHVLDPPVDVAKAAAERSRQLAGDPHWHRQQAQQAAQAYLQQLLATHAPDIDNAAATVIESSLVADGILRFAQQQQMDLIVMATHGYTGLKRWVYGSVMEKVLHGDAPAMLVVRVPDQLLN